MANIEDSAPAAGDESSRIQVPSYFVRKRNALAVRADMAPIYVDHYLHQMDHQLTLEPRHDQMLKDALAAMILHVVTRPWKETHAWTLNFQDPLINLFVTGGSLGENVTGRVFAEGVKEAGHGIFHAQVTIQNEEPRRSLIELHGSEVFESVEQFYRLSEQRPARIFRHTEEDFVMISAQPGCDLDWLASLDDEMVRRLDQDEELSLLETRAFQFSCGCNLERIFPALAPIARQGLDELFQGDEAITVTCPRCAAKWRVTREQLAAVMNS